MLSVKKILKKRTALFLAMLMFIVTITSAIPVFAVDPITVAAWDYPVTTPTTVFSSASVPATSGANQTGANLTNFTATTPKYSTASINIASGWAIGAYWQVIVSTKGYKDLTLSAKTRSSNTGPRDFKVQYSTDGTTFNDITGSAYAITATSLSNYMPTVTLPTDAANCDNLLIRFVVTSNVGVNATSYATTTPPGVPGPSNINNIAITGTADEVVPTKVTAVTANPSDSKIALSCATAGATIKYSMDDGNNYANYTGEITLEKLPAAIKAYAVKTSLDNSDVAVFSYTQEKAAAVTAAPSGGSIASGSSVTLSCTTSGAAIKYSSDGALPILIILTSSANDIDLGTKFNVNSINSEIVAKVAGTHSSIQLQLNYTGAFGFTGVLTVKLPTEKVGSFANLFYFNPTTKQLEFQTSGVINKDGTTQLNFKHASDYVIVLDNAPMGEDISAGAGIIDNAAPIIANELPYAITFVILTAAMIAVKLKKANR